MTASWLELEQPIELIFGDACPTHQRLSTKDTEKFFQARFDGIICSTHRAHAYWENPDWTSEYGIEQNDMEKMYVNMRK